MTSPPKPIRPLVSPETMKKIVSSRRSISSEEALQEMARHVGKPLSPARKLVSKNGREVWVSS